MGASDRPDEQSASQSERRQKDNRYSPTSIGSDRSNSNSMQGIRVPPLSVVAYSQYGGASSVGGGPLTRRRRRSLNELIIEASEPASVARSEGSGESRPVSGPGSRALELGSWNHPHVPYDSQQASDSQLAGRRGAGTVASSGPSQMHSAGSSDASPTGQSGIGYGSVHSIARNLSRKSLEPLPLPVPVRGAREPLPSTGERRTTGV